MTSTTPPEKIQTRPEPDTPESAGRKNSGTEPEHNKNSGSMELSGHLRELRNRLIVYFAGLFIAVAVSLYFADEIVQALLRLGEPYDYRFVYLAPQELLLEYFSVAFVCGVCVTVPILFYEIWAFLRPGLEKNERLFFLLAMIFGLLSAVVGVLFAYRILVPFMLFFLIGLSRGSGIQPAVSVQNYISFLLTMFVIFAVIFELPVVTVLLTQLNLLKLSWLRRARKVMIVVIFLTAALITPPDIVSQIMVAVPLLVLYEVSILLCTIAAKVRKKAD